MNGQGTRKAGWAIILIAASATFSAAKADITGIGVKAGFNSAIIVGSDVLGEAWLRRTGFAVGAFLCYEIGENFSLQPEIFFSQKGARFEDVSGVLPEARAKLSYLDLPVLAKFYFPSLAKKIRGYLFTGPNFSLWLSGKTVLSAGGESAERKIENANSLDFGLTFGGGVEFPLGAGKISLDARWTWGLSWIEKDREEKNVVFSFLLGYSFK